MLCFYALGHFDNILNSVQFSFFSPNSFSFTFREITGYMCSHLGVNCH